MNVIEFLLKNKESRIEVFEHMGYAFTAPGIEVLEWINDLNRKDPMFECWLNKGCVYVRVSQCQLVGSKITTYTQKDVQKFMVHKKIDTEPMNTTRSVKQADIHIKNYKTLNKNAPESYLKKLYAMVVVDSMRGRYRIEEHKFRLNLN